MKVLLLLPYSWDTSPGQRYRIEQWVPLLKEQGVEFVVDCLMTPEEQNLLYQSKSSLKKGFVLVKSIIKRELRLRKIRANDVDCIWMPRCSWPIGPAISEKRLVRRGFPLIYDFDDAIWLINTSEVNKRWGWLKHSSKTGEICKIASHCVVGNNFLAEFARQRNPNVTIIPPTVDLDTYVLDSPLDENRYQLHNPSYCTIGWTGSHTTSPYLKIVEPALRIIAQRHNILFRVIGDTSYSAEGIPLELVTWRSKTEVDDLRPVDIGIMPLDDNEWSRGKCGMKAIQYMALGIPTVVSPVGFNMELIQHNVNGMLAASIDDWVNCLETLIKDAALRKRLGQQGRNTVEQGFCATAQAPRAYEVIKEVVEKTKKP